MSHSNGPIRILYLDDRQVDATLVTSIIESAGEELPATVECVSTRDAYLAAIQTCTHDLILSDYRMIGYDGDQALRDAKEICPDTPFIMVTGETGEERAIETLKRGATDYVLKDGLARLIPSIKRALKDAAAERERREIARSLLEAQRMAHIGNWEWNIKTGALRWSSELFSIYRLDPDSSNPTLAAFTQFVHPDDRDLVNEKISEVVAKGTPVNFDFRIVAADGSRRVLHTIGEVREFDADGKPLIMAGTNQDITDRKQAEEDLRQALSRAEESGRMLSAIMECVPEGITIADAQGNVRMVSLTGARILGRNTTGTPVEEALSNWMVYEPDGVTPMAAENIPLIRAAKKGETVQDVELVQVNAAGQKQSFLCNAAPLRDSAGNITGGIVAWRDISARKEVEQALKKSQQRLEDMIRYAPTFIYEIDFRKRRFTEVNEAMCAFTGLSREKLLASDPMDFLSEESQLRFRERMVRWLKGEKPDEYVEYRAKHPSGEERWVILNVSFTTDKNGTPLGATVIGHDVTEHRRMENALRESEEKFRALSEASPAAVLVYHGNTHRYANPAASAISGYTNDELCSMNFLDLIHPEHKELVRKWASARASGDSTPARYQVKLVTKERQTKWIDVSSALIRYEGLPAGIVVCIDITARKEIEDALRESEERFRIMANSAPIIIVVTDEVGRTEMVNQAFAEFFGTGEQELRGSDDWAKFIHPEESTPTVTAAREAHAERRPIDAQVRVRNRTGEWRWLLYRGVPRFSDSGRFLGMVGVGVDITEQKLMEQTLQRSAENLRLMVRGAYKPMLVVDREGIIEAINEAGASLLGYREEDLTGRGVENLIVPLSRMEAALQLGDLRKHAPRPLNSTLRIVRKDGSSAWVSVEASLVVAGDGMTEKYLVKFEKLDVSAQREA